LLNGKAERRKTKRENRQSECLQLSECSDARARRKEGKLCLIIQIHRVLRAALEKVYRTLFDPDAMAKWL
jgi:hypothetical protein